MSSELKYKIADKVVFQKVKTALGKNKSFIGLMLKVLDWLKAEIHREMVEWPDFQNGFAVLGSFAKILSFEGSSFVFSWARQLKN